jgi:hypothetical protein
MKSRKIHLSAFLAMLVFPALAFGQIVLEPARVA